MTFAVFDLLPLTVCISLSCSFIRLYLLFYLQFWASYLAVLYMIIWRFFGKWTRGIKRVNTSLNMTT